LKGGTDVGCRGIQRDRNWVVVCISLIYER
jgi:hypothetical protein